MVHKETYTGVAHVALVHVLAVAAAVDVAVVVGVAIPSSFSCPRNNYRYRYR